MTERKIIPRNTVVVIFTMSARKFLNFEGHLSEIIEERCKQYRALFRISDLVVGYRSEVAGMEEEFLGIFKDEVREVAVEMGKKERREALKLGIFLRVFIEVEYKLFGVDVRFPVIVQRLTGKKICFTHA